MPQQAPTETAFPADQPLPPWAEADVTFRKLSTPQQRAIVHIVSPLYQHLVLQPQDPVERSCGVSVIHLIWSELLKQCELASLSYSASDYSETRRGRQFNELFGLLKAKCELSSLLVRLRQHPLKPSTSAEPVFSAVFPLDPTNLSTLALDRQR